MKRALVAEAPINSDKVGAGGNDSSREQVIDYRFEGRDSEQEQQRAEGTGRGSSVVGLCFGVELTRLSNNVQV